MPSNPTAFERLMALKAEVRDLEEAALGELVERRKSLIEQLDQVNVELAELTACSTKKGHPALTPSGTG